MIEIVYGLDRVGWEFRHGIGGVYRPKQSPKRCAIGATVRAHPTSQFSQRATPPRSDDKKDEVIKPPTKAIIVRFFGVLIYRRY
jgi:hypothetical protein